jgi:putative ABC transport system permease protein
VFEIGLPETRYRSRADASRFHQRLLESLQALPGVRRAAAVGRCLPLVGGLCGGEALELEGQAVAEGTIPPITGARVATPDYFAAMGVPVRGRVFTPADARGEATGAILSEAAAAAYVPDGDAIGRRVRFGGGGPWHTIVGVAADVRGRLDTDRFSRLIYLPPLDGGHDGPAPSLMTYVLSTAVAPASLGPAVREAVAAADPLLPVADMRTLEDHINLSTAPTGFALALIGLAAGVTLVLGAVGVYAVVAYAVSRRTTEIGVRMAIGATPAAVRRLVLREGGFVVLAGIGTGLVAALGLGRFVDGMLFGVTATDPRNLALITAAMLVVAAAALALPARRASRVDPAVALRNE